MVVNLLKLVQSGALGEPAAILYRVLFTCYTMQQAHYTPQEKEIEKSVSTLFLVPSLQSEALVYLCFFTRLVLELVFKHPLLIPNTIDFISSVQSSNAASPLPLNLTSQVVQFLSTAPLKQLLPHFPLYLVFIKHALAHPQINPVVRKLEDECQSSLLARSIGEQYLLCAG